MIRRVIVAVCLLLAVAPARAQRFADVPTLTIRPNSSADLALPFINASVRLSCLPHTGAGGLSCTALEEFPAGLGFGQAASRIAARFHRAPTVEDGAADGLELRFNFCFDNTLACLDTPTAGALPISLEDTALANIVEGPRLGDLERHYPLAARRAGIEAIVNVQCRVRHGGRYDECVVISEEPRGWGFGAATLALMARSRAAVMTSEGRSLIGHLIIVPISYRRP